MIKLVVAGAAGRMGKAILRLAIEDKALRIAGALEHPQSASLGADIGELIGCGRLGVEVSEDPLAVLKKAHVLIDFTHPSATTRHLQAAVKTRTSYVLGTTGLGNPVLRSLRQASRRIAIVQSPNMSIGVNLLFKLAEITAKALGENYDIELSEIHHRLKKDAPSGTAMKLVEILAEARKKNPAKDILYGRKGETGARPRGKIGVFALRGGDVIGDHLLSFLGDGERIELIHRATSRDAFAQGAIRAAKFVAIKRTGLYHMQQVLGIA